MTSSETTLGGGGKEVARISADELRKPWEYVRFDFADPLGRDVEGIAVRVDGEVIAFENLCPHLGMPLDCHSGDFRSVNGRSLVCDAHGARFNPDDGLCTLGPCEGDRLEMLRVELDEDDGEYVITRGRGVSISAGS